MADEVLGAKMQGLVAEYNSLRTEIHGRTRDQLLCVTTSLVAVGAALGAVAARPEIFSGLLVLAPWLLAVLGIVWCDHAHAIHMIALYIREEIEQKGIVELLSSTGYRAIGWESYVQNRRETSSLPGWINIALPLMYFALPAAACIVAYFVLRGMGSTDLPRILEYFFVGVGVLLLGVLIFAWRRAFRLSR
jgi:hypothetical protein